MIYYEEKMVDDFKKLVTDYLSDIINNNPYKDPDGFKRSTDSQFYKDYRTFLNKQSKFLNKQRKNENRYEYQKKPRIVLLTRNATFY